MIRQFSRTGIGETTKLTPERIQSLLRQGDNVVKTLNDIDISQPEEKPTSVFDVEKSQYEAMFKLYQRTGDIQAINERFGVEIKEFKYGLPIPNIDPQIRGLDDLYEELKEDVPTAIENLYKELSLDADSDFDLFTNAIQSKYNFSSLLGEEEDQELIKELEAVTIPIRIVKDEKVMNTVRKTTTINLNLPGCMETEDPNRFLEHIRPIEEFRHTPLVPISDRQMEEFEEKKRKLNQDALYFNVSFEKFSSVFLFCSTGLVIGYFFSVFMKNEEDMMINYHRKKLERYN